MKKKIFYKSILKHQHQRNNQKILATERLLFHKILGLTEILLQSF